MPFAETPLLGINLAQVYTTLNGVSAGSNPPQLGTIIAGDGGSQWIFCQASTTVPSSYAVGIDQTFKANPLSSTMAAQGITIAWAQQAIDPSTGLYFWAQMSSRNTAMNIAVASSCAAAVPLYTTTTPGILDDSATATQSLIEGIVILTTQASTTGLTGTPGISTYARNR